jgi:hypothetical protein
MGGREVERSQWGEGESGKRAGDTFKEDSIMDLMGLTWGSLENIGNPGKLLSFYVQFWKARNTKKTLKKVIFFLQVKSELCSSEIP